MAPTLKAELRKLLTVRSTYVVFLVMLIIIGITAFWVEGYKGIGNEASSHLKANALEDLLINTATVASLGFITAILLMAHEYRHNLITYTLTAANSRSKVLLSKIIILTGYAIAVTALCVIITLACYYIGLALRDASLPAQDVDWLYMLARLKFYVVAEVLLGLMMAALTRSVVAAIAIMLLVPSMLEPLLGLLLKTNAVYLPFAALEQVGAGIDDVDGHLGVGKAVLVSGTYLVIGWLITWLLFLRRDAN